MGGGGSDSSSPRGLVKTVVTLGFEPPGQQGKRAQGLSGIGQQGGSRIQNAPPAGVTPYVQLGIRGGGLEGGEDGGGADGGADGGKFLWSVAQLTRSLASSPWT